MNKHNTIVNDVINATRGAEMWRPLLTQSMQMGAWAEWIKAQPLVITRSGWEISPARAALNSAQFAMSNLAMGLRAAVDLKLLPYTAAMKEIKQAYSLMDQVSAGFAALRGENHRELVVADVTLLVKDGAFDQMRGSEEAVTEDELYEMGFDPEQVEEFLEMQQALHDTRQPGMGKDTDRASEDEGEFRTAFHTAQQLFDVDPNDIKYAELAYAQVALIGQQWPTDHPLWDDVVTRVMEAWATARVFISDDKSLNTAERDAKLAEHDEKCERRLPVLENLQAKPGSARWVLNHVARRIWRDMQVITRRGTQAQEEIDKLVQEDYLAERYHLGEAQGVRNHGRHRDEGQERWRSTDLLYRVVREDEIRHGDQKLDLHLGYDEGGRYVQVHEYLEEGETRTLDAELRYLNEVVMTAAELLEGLTTIYAKLVKIEARLAPIWTIFQKEGRPLQPPVYWNNRGFYLTEEEAQAALERELNEYRLKAKMAENDALVQVAILLASDNG